MKKTLKTGHAVIVHVKSEKKNGKVVVHNPNNSKTVYKNEDEFWKDQTT